MVSPGHFKLHSACVPDLKAGDYVLNGEHELEAGGETFETEALRSHLRVTSPRFLLPPEQILSTFPPANSEGAYESTLPQIVIRRRTLPWERKAAADAPDDLPWLALVVIAEGEGTLSAESPVADCVTPGVTLEGRNDVATSVYLSVSESVVRKTFPTRQDLPLLAHVREVDLRDTELALGDDDGFLAVVLANRLPQFDRENCKPVRYLACLINLEGQLSALPAPSAPQTDFHATVRILEYAAAEAEIHRDPDLVASGVVAEPQQRYASKPKAQAKGGGKASVQSWATSAREIEKVALTSKTLDASREVRHAMGVGFRVPLELFIIERFYRFPVLAHWSFTCNGAGSFGSYMRDLDVGLLGTAPPDPKGRRLPPCSEPVGGTAPPGAPATRPEPELAETGHVGLPHVSRDGESLQAWYRGPLTPHVTQRESPDGSGRLPLAHVSDQLRRVVPDGREDISYAAAFEIGRLLALSQPSVISALMRWRRDRFLIERGAMLVAQARAGLTQLLPQAEWLRRPELGDLVAKQFVRVAGDTPDVLGPRRPLVDPGRPLDLAGQNLDQVLAAGFGIPESAIAALRGSGGHPGPDRVGLDALNELRQSEVTVLETPGGAFDRAAADHLRSALTREVEAVAEDILRRPEGGGE